MSLPALRHSEIQNQLHLLLERSQRAQRADGGVLEPDWGLPAAMRATQMVLAVALLPPASHDGDQERRLAAARAALSWLDGARTPSGRHNLPTTNPDSAPDTGFVVQLLALAVESIRRHRRADLADLETGLLTHIRTCLPGLATGGFHTPNHRWVISSALAMARSLLGPLPEADAALTAYLAEGLDIDDQGAWIERSAGAYDAVNDRSVLLLAEHGAIDREQALAAVRANLDLDRALLNADATIEVALSSRQDHGTTTVPDELAAVMVWAGVLDGDPALAGLGAWVYGQADPTDNGIVWMAAVMDALGLPEVAAAAPGDESRWLPSHGMWRRRVGAFSSTVLTTTPAILGVRYGAVAVSAVTLHHTYFGPQTGTFHPDVAAPTAEGIVLRSNGTRDPRRPGYDLPLGRAVHPADWESARHERELLSLPPMATTVEIRARDRGLDLGIRTESGLSDIPAVAVIDLPAGGVWRTPDLELRPVAGQTLLLRSSYLDVTVGGDTLRIGPGSDAHAMWQPRNLAPRPHLVRVLIPLMTPIAHTVTIEALPTPSFGA